MFLLSTVIAFKNISGVSNKNSLTEAALGWSCLGRYLKEDNKFLYTPKDKYVRKFIKQIIHGGRVLACIKKVYQNPLHILSMY